MFQSVPRTIPARNFGVEAPATVTQLQAALFDSRAARPACCRATANIAMDDDGQIQDAHSIWPGVLDYPGIGPEHSWLH